MTHQRKSNYENTGSPSVGFRSESGFTLIEIMIAIAILAIGILGLMAMQLTAAKSNTQARKVTESAAWAADEFERLLLADYDDLAAGASTPSDSLLNNTALPADTFRGPYTVTYNVTENTPIDNVKRIEITVAWNDGSGRSTTLTYYKGKLF